MMSNMEYDFIIKLLLLGLKLIHVNNRLGMICYVWRIKPLWYGSIEYNEIVSH